MFCLFCISFVYYVVNVRVIVEIFEEKINKVDILFV